MHFHYEKRNLILSLCVIVAIIVIILSAWSHYRRDHDRGYEDSGLADNVLAASVPAVQTLPTASFTISTTTLSVELARTVPEQEQGLSYRQSLSADHGMLFVFDSPQEIGFWMKDMHFPLDMIWFDQHMKVIDITKNATPDSYPHIFLPRSPVQYVLEVNAGFADAHGVTIGMHASTTVSAAIAH
jgi:uncharacterized membrane protein (UPF0127 family)